MMHSCSCSLCAGRDGLSAPDVVPREDLLVQLLHVKARDVTAAAVTVANHIELQPPYLLGGSESAYGTWTHLPSALNCAVAAITPNFSA
jgi:hypothetical protein